MILGVAQVVFNVADLGAASADRLAAGWNETFRVEGLPNNRVKKPFQAAPREALDMVHLTPPAGTAVEFTCYAGAPPAGVAAYAYSDGLAHLAAADAGASREFWQQLGFREDDDGVLATRAMHPSWQLRLAIEPSPDSERPETSVDADGCVLVTVLTTRIEPELARLHDTGLLLRSTPSWTEQIADRATNVAIVEGPSGELVELLEAPRRSPDDRAA